MLNCHRLSRDAEAARADRQRSQERSAKEHEAKVQKVRDEVATAHKSALAMMTKDRDHVALEAEKLSACVKQLEKYG